MPDRRNGCEPSAEYLPAPVTEEQYIPDIRLTDSGEHFFIPEQQGPGNQE